MALSKHNVQPVDPILTRFINDYMQSKDYFIADKLFPAVPVSAESGTYYEFHASKDKFLLPNKTERAPGALYGRGQLNVATATYQTIEDGWEIPVDDRIAAIALPPYDPRRTAAENAAEVVALRREFRVIAAITNATTFAGQTAALAGANRWDDPNSEPIDAVDTYKELVRASCGLNPNTMVLPYHVWLHLKEHPVIVDRLKITSDKIVTVDLLARLFGFDRILLSMAKYNSAEEGQTVVLTDMMTTQVFMGYVSPAPALDRPSVGYSLQFEGMVAETYREEQTRSEIARARINEVHRIIAADCGYLLTTVVS